VGKIDICTACKDYVERTNSRKQLAHIFTHSTEDLIDVLTKLEIALPNDLEPENLVELIVTYVRESCPEKCLLMN